MLSVSSRAEGRVVRGPHPRKPIGLGMMLRFALVNILAGAILSLAGLVATFSGGLPVAEILNGGEDGLAWGDIAVGIFLVGVLAWWVFVGRSQRSSLLRGAVAGALTGVFSYPAVLATAELFNSTPDANAAIGQATSVTQLSGFGLLTTGFAAVPTMAIAGMLTALLLRPLYPVQRGIDPALRVLRGVGVALAVLVGILVAAFIWLSVLPPDRELLAGAGSAEPRLSYEQAVAAYEAVRGDEARMPINPRCASTLLLQSDRQAPTVIFIHGVTNCPAQADELAPMLFDLGYNVYVPRLPGHGEVDRMTTSLARVSAQDYIAATEQAIEIGLGLGGPVVVTGLSAGGVLALWSGQQRADVDYTIAMAPFLGPNMVPIWANRAATNLLLLLPNIMIDWDSENPEGSPEMNYAYPRVASRALGQFMAIGEMTTEMAETQPPLAQGLGMIVNEADTEVNGRLIERIVKAWQGKGAQVDVTVFPLSLRLPHDFIDPRQENANTDVTYPVLVDMIGNGVGAGDAE